uniref:Uncharacterized protein n=1 Tax=Vitis vinifera TaxID=29760 RepID=F6HRJ1_VITVI
MMIDSRRKMIARSNRLLMYNAFILCLMLPWRTTWFV